MRILAVNPWITDFAAYDFWLKPYGFLVLLTYLKNQGHEIDYIDCLDRKISHDRYGRGKFYSIQLTKPAATSHIPRIYKRYGITINQFQAKLENKKPDVILLTSSMTYWYKGLVNISKILKARFPGTPIILGGTYASLCYNHASKNTACDFVYKNDCLEDFFTQIKCKYQPKDLLSTLPEYDFFYNSLEYIVLRTTWGCPMRCSFCAIAKLYPKFLRLGDDKITDFIKKYSDSGMVNFVFYDDALIYKPEDAKKLFSKILKLKRNLNFHTPNAIHLRFLDQDLACLLKRAGFINPHFGLEVLDKKLQKLWGKDKIKKENLKEKIDLLKKAGYKKGGFSMYLLLGYPGQDIKQLKQDIDFLNSQGAKISLSEFSPVPGTDIFNEYCPDLSEPLLQNNSIFNFFNANQLKEIQEIKNYTKKLNSCFSL
ncbi:MAG: radical SAM protein [Candidatus Omnitrophica bacterium]|nr:radical SAM protein [Candidatus Omnitrophota bacterium]